jgi:hypothetical protein
VNQFTAERVAARQEIQHRVLQFCRAVDRLDLDLAREAFHADALDDHGAYKGDIDGLVTWVRERHKTLRYSCHHVGSIYVEFAGDQDAFVESHVWVWQSVTPNARIFDIPGAPADGEFELLSPGRYVDHFTLRDGAWRIQRRVTLSESAMAVPGGGGADASAVGFASPTRDADDPAEQLRIKLGLRPTS